jgi:hypothetical protein
MTARRPRLLYPGTLVTVTLGDYTAHGVVEHYEYHNPHQTAFPVKFGSRTRIMTASVVTVLPDDQQPDDRKPPPCTCLMPCDSI